VRRHVLIPMLLLGPALMGCGHHASSSGPTAAAPRHATQAPSLGVNPVTHVSAVRLTRWRLPYPVARAALIRTGRGSLILAGGLLTGDRSTGRAARVDLSSGSATTLPSLAVPVHDTAGGLVGGAPTVVGGGNTTEQSVVQSLGQGGWVRIGSLPSTRSDLGVVEWRRHAYVLGGYDGVSALRTILRLAPRTAPRPVGSLLQGVRYAAMARIHSDVFVFGGEVAGRELSTVQRVDLTTGRTRPAGHLPLPVGHAMAVTIGDRVLLMGGRVTPERQTAEMWWYDAATGRFRRAGRLPFPLSDATVASRGHRVWVLGGETPAVTDRVLEVRLR
jgi:hypothetical protein